MEKKQNKNTKKSQAKPEIQAIPEVKEAKVKPTKILEVKASRETNSFTDQERDIVIQDLLNQINQGSNIIQAIKGNIKNAADNGLKYPKVRTIYDWMNSEKYSQLFARIDKVRIDNLVEQMRQIAENVELGRFEIERAKLQIDVCKFTIGVLSKEKPIEEKKDEDKEKVVPIITWVKNGSK